MRGCHVKSQISSGPSRYNKFIKMSAKKNALEQWRAWGEIVYGANVCLEMKKKIELQTTQKKWANLGDPGELSAGAAKIPELEHQGWERVWEFMRVVFGKPVDFGVWHTGSPSGPGGPLSPKSPGKPWGHRESSFNAPLQSRYRKTHHQVQRTSAIFASQHLANNTRLTWFHLAPPRHSSLREQTNKQK